ncbi:MAG: ATP-binding protein [Spirulina sp.]
MVTPRVAAKPITLFCQVAEAAQTCVADEQRLRQMLLNLLSNAIKFTDQGQVTLTVQSVGGMVQFEVADTGIGIADDQRGRLFKPFTQLDSDLNRRYDGTGLGLALTQQLAQLHGGYVAVESEEGHGSRFSLYLPVDGRPSRSPHPLETSVSPPSLFLLDPDPHRSHPWMTYLQLCGWQMRRQTHWAEALPILQRQPPHLLVLLSQDNATTLAADLQTLPPPRPKIVLLGEIGPLPAPMAPLAAMVDLTLALPLTVPKLERLLALSPAHGWDQPV